MLFDMVVRYGQQHNPDYEAKNEAPPNAPYAKFSKMRCTLSNGQDAHSTGATQGREQSLTALEARTYF
ncbi:hypothetical protein LYNGBM3L_16740 [Moorena producens 3L]|uniref:Uncharacterized protein n=1 Tax=Moorena producens 3L TaxID=489825 RepID=F4XSA9_9CYAN|nr:hypothetical protein LYNGBM3L_16740 [Moorena producens 3L]OLT68293.1 hypothetical protein BI334_27730 [Moorena producens 3L]